MKLTKVFILLLALQLMSCKPTKDVTSFSNNQGQGAVDLAKYVIGQWQGNFLEGTDKVSYLFEFEEPNILYYRKNSSDPSKGEAYNFEYYFIDESTVELKGRIRDKWYLSKDDSGDLIIHSAEGILPDAHYKRSVRKNNTGYIVGVGVILLFYFLFYVTIRNRQKNSTLEVETTLP